MPTKLILLVEEFKMQDRGLFFGVVWSVSVVDNCDTLTTRWHPEF